MIIISIFSFILSALAAAAACHFFSMQVSLGAILWGIGSLLSLLVGVMAVKVERLGNTLK